MSRVPIAIVGFGKIARDQHVPAIAAGTDFELVAVADPAGSDDAWPAYRDISAMIAAQPEIAAVSLCMPPHFRAAAAREAIAAGRHVLLEKPPCASFEEASELENLAREAGVTLFTAWHSQKGAAVAAAREWLRGRTIESVRVNWKEDVRVWHPGQAWIWQRDGFGVFDPGINALSILTAILPGPLRLVEADLTVPANCETPIAARLELAGRRRVEPIGVAVPGEAGRDRLLVGLAPLFAVLHPTQRQADGTDVLALRALREVD